MKKYAQNAFEAVANAISGELKSKFSIDHKIITHPNENKITVLLFQNNFGNIENVIDYFKQTYFFTIDDSDPNNMFIKLKNSDKFIQFSIHFTKREYPWLYQHQFYNIRQLINMMLPKEMFLDETGLKVKNTEYHNVVKQIDYNDEQTLYAVGLNKSLLPYITTEDEFLQWFSKGKYFNPKIYKDELKKLDQDKDSKLYQQVKKLSEMEETNNPPLTLSTFHKTNSYLKRIIKTEKNKIYVANRIKKHFFAVNQLKDKSEAEKKLNILMKDKGFLYLSHYLNNQELQTAIKKYK